MSDTKTNVGPVNGSPVDVVMDVDGDGRVVVTVADHPWLPHGRVAPDVPIGRTDVPWILDRLLTEENAPLRVVLHDRGHTYTDLVGPDLALNRSAGASPLRSRDMSSTTSQPSAEQAHTAARRHRTRAPGLPEPEPGHGSTPPRTPDDGSPGDDGNTSGEWFEAGGYTAGERVAVAVIVTRLAADDRGWVGFTIPPALRQAVGEMIAVGEESREIYTNQAGYHFPSQEHFAPLLRGETTPSHDNAAGPATGSGTPRPDDPPEMGM